MNKERERGGERDESDRIGSDRIDFFLGDFRGFCFMDIRNKISIKNIIRWFILAIDPNALIESRIKGKDKP